MSDIFDNFLCIDKVLGKVLVLNTFWLPCLKNGNFAIIKGKSFGALMTDLSKAFDWIYQEPIITKLHAYGFDKQALELTNSYLSEKKKIENKIRYSLQFLEGNSFWSPYKNIFLCDLFVHLKDIDFASYADDNTPYTEHDSIDHVISRLEETVNLFLSGFLTTRWKLTLLSVSHF